MNKFMNGTCFDQFNMKSEKAPHVPIKEGTVVGPFVILKRIGHGGYGDVYTAVRKNGKKKYALKFESLDKPRLTLEHEVQVLRTIAQPGFPVVHSSGGNSKAKWFAMELYGKSFSQLRRLQPNRKFPMEFVIAIADETFKLIWKLHRAGYIHRDIKPSNFVAHRFKNTQPIYLIDFGFAKLHIDEKTGKPFPKSSELAFIGTTMYASTNALNGLDLGRCDDLVSWFYMIVEFIQGRLPWCGGQRNEVMKSKANVTPEDLCMDMPKPLRDVYCELRRLKYEDEPNYEYISRKLKEAAEFYNIQNDKALWDLFDEYVYTNVVDEEEEESEYSLTFGADDEACLIA